MTDVDRLIRELGRPEAYPHRVENVEVRQTHISLLFFAGPYVYKVKKPLDLGFLDFRTLERRRHFCHEEVRLNRRLAPEVYLGVVPITDEGGGLSIGSEPEPHPPGPRLSDDAGRVGPDHRPVEYAVKMERLPREATFLALLERGLLSADTISLLGRRIAAFHAVAASGPEIDRCARFDVVAGNARDNLREAERQVGRSLSRSVLDRLTAALETRLAEAHERIERRAVEHRAREIHGDLRLEHLYHVPDRHPPHDLIAIDCIEFQERFRYADPVSDIAFPIMELLLHGHPHLAGLLERSYFDVCGDASGRPLLGLYLSYRAAVRGKVQGILAGARHATHAEREEALRSSIAQWLLALSELEGPAERPGLVLIGGLPGTGKSTLAEGLAEAGGFEVISSDRVRKELAGIPLRTRSASSFGAGIYTAEWNDRTYDRCLELATGRLFEGGRVIVDASFREAARRRRFLEVARSMGLRTLFIECRVSSETARTRISRRQAQGSDPSDADWAVHEAARRAWEPDAPPSPFPMHRISTEGSVEVVVARAVEVLRAEGLGPR